MESLDDNRASINSIMLCPFPLSIIQRVHNCILDFIYGPERVLDVACGCWLMSIEDGTQSNSRLTHLLFWVVVAPNIVYDVRLLHRGNIVFDVRDMCSHYPARYMRHRNAPRLEQLVVILEYLFLIMPCDSIVWCSRYSIRCRTVWNSNRISMWICVSYMQCFIRKTHWQVPNSWLSGLSRLMKWDLI